MFVLCHDQRAYPRACLLHVSLNELLEAQEAEGAAAGGGWTEWKRRTETRKRTKESTWDLRCRETLKSNCTDCTICLYDVLWIVSWVHLLVREALFGAQSSCQAMREVCPPQTDRQTDTCRHPELSNPFPLSWTKQWKIRDREDEIVCQSRLDRRKTKFSFLTLLALCRLFDWYDEQLSREYDCYMELPYGVLFFSGTLLHNKCRVSWLTPLNNEME